ncbi:MAG TPA: APC family permease [Jatrophihabitans sp.]|jgi:amino acid transporter|nr:APC family permease [Jatrophihabitans sp.]
MSTTTAAPQRLRRELRLLETAALSVGVMAPTLAMSITGPAAAKELGRATPLAFVIAAAAVALVAFGFVRLAAEFSHAGSVYAFVGLSLAPRWGFVAGWALLGTYLVFPWVSVSGVTIFARAFLDTTGIAHDADWYPIALVAWAVIWVLAVVGIRPTTRWLIVFELISVLLILLLMVIIVIRLASGTHTIGGTDGLPGSVFKLPSGVGTDALALAATSGFLAFAGFESAASLGEESLRPRHEIPRALWTAVGFGAVFYVACMTTQSWGFGVNDAGVSAFTNSQASLGDLAQHYSGKTLAALLDVGAVLSAVGAALGCVTVAVRMLFALGRDRLVAGQLGTVTPHSRVPGKALAFELTLGLVLLTAFRLEGTPPLNIFFYLATIGVLSLLCMYILTNIAALRRLGHRALWEAVLPLVGAGIAGYVLYRNVWPIPAAPYRYFPYAILAWLAAALAATFVFPALVRRAGTELAARTEEQDDARADRVPERG